MYAEQPDNKRATPDTCQGCKLVQLAGGTARCERCRGFTRRGADVAVEMTINNGRPSPLAGAGSLRLTESKRDVVLELGGTEAGQILAFRAFQQQLAERCDEIKLLECVLAPSKGEPRKADGGLTLFRDLETEAKVRYQISLRGGDLEVLRQLRLIDPSCGGVGGAQQAIGRVVSGRVFEDGQNFFLFAPGVFCLDSVSLNDHCSFELLDFSEWMLWAVGRCVATVFGEATGIAYKHMINRSTIAFTVCAGATAHESGHRCLPVRVVPERDPRVAGLSPLSFDTLGELGADSVGVRAFGQVFGARLPVYLLLYRVFYYCRVAFAKDPINGVQADNDALGGAFCWRVMEETGALKFKDGRFTFELGDAEAVWSRVLDDLKRFLDDLVAMPLDQQDHAARHWIGKMVPRDDYGQFVWPDSLAEALRRCRDIPVTPGDVSP